MKRLLCLLLSLTMLLELCACGQKVEKPADKPAAEPVDEEIIDITDILPEAEDTAELVARGDHYAEEQGELNPTYAESCYVEALAADPTAQEVYEKRADFYLSQGDEIQAAKILAVAAEKSDSTTFKKEALAKSAELRKGQWEKRCSEADEALERGDTSSAMLAYTAALEADPSQAETLEKRGDIYMKSPITQDAGIRDYKAALRLEPKEKDLYIKLADAYSEQDEPEKASAILEKGARTLHSKDLEKRRLVQAANQYTDEELIEFVNDTFLPLISAEYGIRQGAYFHKDYKNEARKYDGKMWCKVDDPRADSLADVDKVWHEQRSSNYPLPELEYYKEIDGELYAIAWGIGGPYWDHFEVTSISHRDGLRVELYGILYDSKNFETNTGGMTPYFVILDYEDSQWKYGGDACYTDRNGAWASSSIDLDAFDLADPDEITAMGDQHNSGDDTGDELTLVPLFPLKELYVSEIWDKLEPAVLDNILTSLHTQIGCASRREQLLILGELLRYKPIIAACQEQTTLNSLGGKTLKRAKEYLAKEYGTIDNWDEPAYGAMASIYLDVMVAHPSQIKAVLTELLSNQPQLVLSAISELSKEGPSKNQIPTKMKLSVAVMEKMARGYLRLTDSAGQIPSEGDEEVQALIELYEKLKKKFSGYMNAVIEAANNDLNQNSTASLPLVRQTCITAQQEKEALIAKISEHQTFLFKITHRELNKKLDALKEETEQLLTDFEPIYWVLISDSLEQAELGAPGTAFSMPKAPISVNTDGAALVTATYNGNQAELDGKVEWISKHDRIMCVVGTRIEGNRLTAVVQGKKVGSATLMLRVNGKVQGTVIIHVNKAQTDGEFSPVKKFPVDQDLNVLPFVKKDGSLTNLLQLHFQRKIQPGCGNVLIVEKDSKRLVDVLDIRDAVIVNNTTDTNSISKIEFMTHKPLEPDREYFVCVSEGLVRDQADPTLLCRSVSQERWSFATVPLDVYDRTLKARDVLYTYPQFLYNEQMLDHIRLIYQQTMRENNTRKLEDALFWTLGNLDPLVFKKIYELPIKSEEETIRAILLQASSVNGNMSDIMNGMSDDLESMCVEFLKFNADMSLEDFIDLHANLFPHFDQEQIKTFLHDMQADKEFAGYVSTIFDGFDLTLAFFTPLVTYLLMQEAQMQILDTLILELEEAGYSQDVMYKKLLEERDTYYKTSMSWYVAKEFFLSDTTISIVSGIISAKIFKTAKAFRTNLILLGAKLASVSYSCSFPSAEEYFDFYAEAAYAGRLYGLLERKRNTFKQHEADSDDLESFRILHALYCAALHETCEGMKNLSRWKAPEIADADMQMLENYQQALENYSVSDYFADCVKNGNAYLKSVMLQIDYKLSHGKLYPVGYKSK